MAAGRQSKPMGAEWVRAKAAAKGVAKPLALTKRIEEQLMLGKEVVEEQSACAVPAEVAASGKLLLDTMSVEDDVCLEKADDVESEGASTIMVSDVSTGAEERLDLNLMDETHLTEQILSEEMPLLDVESVETMCSGESAVDESVVRKFPSRTPEPEPLIGGSARAAEHAARAANAARANAARRDGSARRAAAETLVTSISGVIDGTYSLSQCESSECVQAVGELLGTEGGAGSSFGDAVEALALAVQAGVVPIQRLATLVCLLNQMPKFGLLFDRCAGLLEALDVRLDGFAQQLEAEQVDGSQWDDLMQFYATLSKVGLDGVVPTSLFLEIQRRLCRNCGKRPPQHPQCQSCNGQGFKPCKKCCGSGQYTQTCRSCNGTGKPTWQSQASVSMCRRCRGDGKAMLGDCNMCHGSKSEVPCDECRDGVPLCDECCHVVKQSQERQHANQHLHRRSVTQRQEGQPAEGVSVARTSASDLAWLQKIWADRAGLGSVSEAWSIDNPLATYRFKERKRVIERELGRQPDELDGFHGSSPDNYLPIIQVGFRSDLRGSSVGQVCGSGEYFAKNPNVSIAYCKGCEYMLVCRLCLGRESSSEANADGDHIWVPESQYYVISCPAQILPLYLLKFDMPPNPNAVHTLGSASVPTVVPTLVPSVAVVPTLTASGCMSFTFVPTFVPVLVSVPVPALLPTQWPAPMPALDRSRCQELDRVLAMGNWTTKKEEAALKVPANRPCLMSRPTASVLWLGLLHAHHSDEQLEDDVRNFLLSHAAKYTPGMKLQIVRGTFKKAHVDLRNPMPRDLVHQLNMLPFVEGGKRRTICVDDAHGSPEQRCPKFIAKYCRGQNLSFTNPCWCWHPNRETDGARYDLELVNLQSAKGNEISTKFMASAPFHNGHPRIVAIHAVKNPVLARLHEEYRRYLATKHREEPSMRELYHGTNNNIHAMLFKHGLQPPSDRQASEDCPVSGGKGLCTTLCDNTCKFCTEKHEWNRCHMFGLGIYLADIAQKSHRYVSQPEQLHRGHNLPLVKSYRMVICSVLGRAFKVEGHLKCADAMHDVVNARALNKADMDGMVEPCCASSKAAKGGDVLAEKSDMLFVQGLGGMCRPGLSVFNSEYVAFHPHQCLPKYEITYEI